LVEWLEKADRDNRVRGDKLGPSLVVSKLRLRVDHKLLLSTGVGWLTLLDESFDAFLKIPAASCYFL
jgi:hypothetical protein